MGLEIKPNCSIVYGQLCYPVELTLDLPLNQMNVKALANRMYMGEGYL